jgi:hypothetical protein
MASEVGLVNTLVILPSCSPKWSAHVGQTGLDLHDDLAGVVSLLSAPAARVFVLSTKCLYRTQQWRDVAPRSVCTQIDTQLQSASQQKLNIFYWRTIHSTLQYFYILVIEIKWTEASRHGWSSKRGDRIEFVRSDGGIQNGPRTSSILACNRRLR